MAPTFKHESIPGHDLHFIHIGVNFTWNRLRAVHPHKKRLMLECVTHLADSIPTIWITEKGQASVVECGLDRPIPLGASGHTLACGPGSAIKRLRKLTDCSVVVVTGPTVASDVFPVALDLLSESNCRVVVAKEAIGTIEASADQASLLMLAARFRERFLQVSIDHLHAAVENAVAQESYFDLQRKISHLVSHAPFNRSPH